MQAIQMTGLRRVSVGDIPAPAPRPGFISLKVSSVGICGSDLHYYNEGALGSATVTNGFVPGHEFAGRLAADLPDRG